MTKEEIAKKEILWVSQSEDGFVKYLISSNQQRSRYYLYKSKDGKSYTKVESNSTPLFKELEKPTRSKKK